MSDGYTVAVVGAGLVGEKLVAELRRRNFPTKELRVLARTARTATLAGEEFEVGVAESDAFEGVDFAFFAGTEGEKGAAVQLAHEAISRGAVVIDNGSDFRLDPDVPLMVPEVNAGALEDGRDGIYPRPIAGNAIPLIGDVGEDGYTTEERKMQLESRKILDLPGLEVFATAVRIPVHTGHSESVFVETEREVPLAEVLETLRDAPGVTFSGDADDFPTPLEAVGDSGTFVGRVRAEGNLISFWCVADNLLKGAATNAVQIAEELVKTGARV